jgi:hypothetical protein
MENYIEHYELWDDEQYQKCIAKVSSRHLKLNDLLRNYLTVDEVKSNVSIKTPLKSDDSEPIKQ